MTKSGSLFAAGLLFALSSIAQADWRDEIESTGIDLESCEDQAFSDAQLKATDVESFIDESFYFYNKICTGLGQCGSRSVSKPPSLEAVDCFRWSQRNATHQSLKYRMLALLPKPKAIFSQSPLWKISSAGREVRVLLWLDPSTVPDLEKQVPVDGLLKPVDALYVWNNQDEFDKSRARKKLEDLDPGAVAQDVLSKTLLTHAFDFVKANGWDLSTEKDLGVATLFSRIVSVTYEKLRRNRVQTNIALKAWEIDMPIAGVQSVDEYIARRSALTALDPETMIEEILDVAELMQSVFGNRDKYWLSGDNAALARVWNDAIRQRAPNVYRIFWEESVTKHVQLIEKLLESSEVELVIVDADYGHDVFERLKARNLVLEQIPL